MTGTDGGRLFARALKREGVEQIFTLSGGHIMPIYYGCRDEGIDVVDFRHECAAGYAADGYAQATGKPAVLVTTAGPGVVDTTMAMAEARDHGIPLIHIGGASPVAQNETGPLQDMNTLEIMAACSRWARKIYQTERIPEYVGMAFRQAMAATPGPVYLEIGTDVLGRAVDDSLVSTPEHYRTDAVPFGDPEGVERATRMLLKASRPFIVVGDGARYFPQHIEAVAELARRLKIPVMSQCTARGLVGDERTDPLFRSSAIAAADVILTLQLSNDYRVLHLKPPIVGADARIIQVHTDVTRIGYNAPAHVGLVGAPGAVASQILESVRVQTEPRSESAWATTAAEITKASGQAWRKGFESDAVPIHPGRCAAEVARFLDEQGPDYTVVADGGDACQWIQQAVSVSQPGQLISFGPDGTIGTGAGFAVGAWYARRKPVLWYTGDGSFGFYAMELDTMAKRGIPVVVVISNDSAWGMIKLSEGLARKEELARRGHVGVDLSHMRQYEKLVSMWDGYGVTVTDPEQIVPSIAKGFASGRPAIVNVEINKVDMSPITAAFGYGMKAH